ncbi:MAG: hypothetical protein BVN35_02210 [Proteobacteria bacterium ST_bin11]|jgi:DNA-binding LytR/AlgR family response regulator|nr:MAG: hypothetical protein BVN35_02210 [Proteobacteria bacterium ST_bin11]
MVDSHSVMIVDDEYLARDELKSLLKRRHPDFNVVAEASTAQAAWALLKDHPRIDGVFLDIHIQTENERAGLDLGYAINRLAAAPWIIFLTGYPQTAVEAHRLHPAHFLLKPLEDDRIDEALAWIRRTQTPLAPMATIHQQPKRIMIKHRIDSRFDEHEWHTECVDPSEIVFIAKNKSVNNLKIQLSNGNVLDRVNGTIKDWESKYAALGFVQIHRSHLINLGHLRSLKPRGSEGEDYKVALKNCSSELAVGPEYLELFREKLHKGEF